MAELAGIEMRGLGSTGPLVSTVGLGCDNFGRRLDQADTTAVVSAAIDSGITLFDTADVYGGGGVSEQYLGEALLGRRDSVVSRNQVRRWTVEAARWETTRARGDHVTTSGARAKRRSSGCRPTASTSTSITSPTE